MLIKMQKAGNNFKTISADIKFKTGPLYEILAGRPFQLTGWGKRKSFVLWEKSKKIVDDCLQTENPMITYRYPYPKWTKLLY